MTPPDDAVKVTKGQSEKPESGRKHLDPSRYQVSTLPAEVRSEYQKLPIHRLSEEELKPPPGYGGTPAPAPNPATAPSPKTDEQAASLPAVVRRQWPLIAAAILLAIGAAIWLTSRTKGETSPTLPSSVAPATAAPQVASKPELKAVPDQTQETNSNSVSKVATAKSEARPEKPRAKAPPAQAKSAGPREPAKPPQEKAVNVLLIDR
jgi:hypothetical protein